MKWHKVIQQYNVVLNSRARVHSAIIIVRPRSVPNSRDTVPIRPATNQVSCPQYIKCEKGP